MAFPSAVISATGIAIPSYDEVLAYLQDGYRGIFGQDVYIDPDSLDGQFLAIQAAAINAANQQAVSTYNAFSPATAQGTGLSSVVKINGLLRLSASLSTADVLIGGTVGTEITNGIAGDAFGNQWLLPALVVIPLDGSIVVTATALVPGAVLAQANTITKIVTPTRGWQTVTNALAAVPGNPVEQDATLRQRQSVSTALPALSVLDSIIGSVANLPGVQRYQGYDNDTGAPDVNGIPAHSIAIVVLGGDAQEIATTIALKKTPGTGTAGNITQTILDPKGVPNTISFYQLTLIPIQVQVTITPLVGYLASTGDAIKAAIAAYISALAIGEDVRWSKVWAPADLYDAALTVTYDVTDIEIGLVSGGLGTANVPIAFNQAASCIVANIVLITSP